MFGTLNLNEPMPAPVAALRVVYNYAMRQRAAAYDGRARLLGEMIAYLESETMESFRAATADSAVATALSLGRKHWTRWGHVMRLGMDLAQELNIGEHAASVAFSAAGWVQAATRAHEHLPKLGPAARRDFRAAAFLMGELAGRLDHKKAAEVEGRLRGADSIFEIPIEQVPEDALLYMSALQALTVAGTQGGFATGVPEALALHFWRVMRDGQDEDSVEDAYWAAVSAEEKLLPSETIRLHDYRPGIDQTGRGC